MDREWGTHLAGLLMRSYGVHGSTYHDGHEWRLWCSSSRAFRDLSNYYQPEWNCRRWIVGPAFFEGSFEVKQGVVRGYFNADGYPNFSRARQQVSLLATSVNYNGLVSMKDLLGAIGYTAGVYRRYKGEKIWELRINRQNDVVRFYREIGFSIERKQEKLAAMLAQKGLPLDQ
jgi:hypothetical protein